MKTSLCRLGGIVLLGLASNICIAQEFSPPTETLTLDNLVLFEGARAPFGGTMTVADQQGQQMQQRFSDANGLLIDIHNFAGNKLADGLYKYEIKPNSALSQLSDVERSMIPANERGLVDTAELFGLDSNTPSPVIGSFRISDGRLVDPHLIEE